MPGGGNPGQNSQSDHAYDPHPDPSRRNVEEMRCQRKTYDENNVSDQIQAK